VEQITERIASVSLPTVLLLLGFLTIARSALYATRVPVFRILADLLESVILAVGLVFLVLRPFVVQSFFIPSGSMHPTLWEGDHILVNKFLYRMRPPERGEVMVFRAPKDAATDEKEFIKRVIGVPGDRIEVRAGYLTVGAMTYTRDEIRATLSATVPVSDLTDSEELPALRLTTDALWYGDRRVAPEEFARLAGRPGQPVRIYPGCVYRNNRAQMECYVAEDPQYEMPPRVIPDGHYFVMGDNRNQSHDSHVWGLLPADRVIGRAEFVFWPPPHARRIGHE
jgi:signal peptidase I